MSRHESIGVRQEFAALVVRYVSSMGGGEFTKSDAEVRTKRSLLFFVMLLAGTAAFLVTLPLLATPLLIGLGWCCLFLFSLAVARAGERWPQVRRGALHADPTGLYLDGNLIVPRASIRSAHVHGRGGDEVVRLVRGFRPVEIVVRDHAEGAALIAGLRLDSSRSIVRYTVLGGTFRWMLLRTCIIAAVTFALGITVPLIVHAWSLVLVLEVSLLVVYFLALFRQNRTLLVGADGVRIRRWFGGARFVHYTEMEAIARDRTIVHLRLRNGESLTMSKGAAYRSAWAKRLFGSAFDEEVEALVARITARIEAHRGPDATTVRAGLVRGERTTSQWLHALRRHGETSATFRTPAIPADVFWAVVEDSTAPATARVGAAVALHDALDDAARARLRVVAEACAAPQVRVALETAARTPGERALMAALEPVEDDGDGSRRGPRLLRAR